MDGQTSDQQEGTDFAGIEIPFLELSGLEMTMAHVDGRPWNQTHFEIAEFKEAHPSHPGAFRRILY